MDAKELERRNRGAGERGVMASRTEDTSTMLTRYWNVQEWLYGGDRDVDYRYTKARIVRVRFLQKCSGIYHEDHKTRLLRPGTKAVLETAWSSDSGKFGSCYTCFDCVKAAEKEWR
jgi:hypothetical protein